MKKCLALIIALLSFTIVFGQQIDDPETGAILKLNEMSLSYGFTSMVVMMEGVRGGEDGYDSRTISNYPGTFCLKYRRILTRTISVGIAIAYENEDGEMKEYIGMGSAHPITASIGTYKRNVFSIAPEFIIQYPRRSRVVSAYGYIGIGKSFLNEEDIYSEAYYNKNYFNGVNSLGNSRQKAVDVGEVNVQICPLGISFGGDFCGFIEIGFGYKGVINGGLSIKF